MKDIDSLFTNYISQEHISAQDTINCLINNNITSLVRERLEVSFGSDLKAIELTNLIIYFAECQYLNKQAEKHDDYFIKDLWTIMHKTHFKSDLLNRLKKQLQDLYILDVQRTSSYQSSCKYRINFSGLQEFLESKEEDYIAYFKEEEDHNEQFNETKKRVIHDNKRKNLRKQYGKTNIWKKISKDYEEQNLDGLLNDGLSKQELFMFRAISYGLEHYQNRTFNGTYHFYNEIMTELSGYTYYEACEAIKDDSNFKTADDFREFKIQQKTSIQSIIEAFNPRNYPKDPSGCMSEETKFVVGHRKANFRKSNSRGFYYNTHHLFQM